MFNYAQPLPFILNSHTGGGCYHFPDRLSFFGLSLIILAAILYSTMLVYLLERIINKGDGWTKKKLALNWIILVVLFWAAVSIAYGLPLLLR